MTEKELLKQLEQRITKEYKDTEAVIRQKIAYFTKEFDKDNKIYQQKVKDGIISEKDYKNWYKKQIITQKKFKKMSEEIAKDITEASVTASKFINNDSSKVFMYGCLEASKELKKFDNFDVIDRKQIDQIMDDNKKFLPKSKVNIPKDQKWNENRIRSSLMQSALKGESIPKLANRLSLVVGMSRTSAVRNARTMMTGSHNMGKLETGREAIEMGINVKKKWIATHDDRTRSSHILLDGETVEMEEEFSNGLMFPADPDGDPAEVYNCRCTMAYVVGDPDEIGNDIAEPEQDQLEFIPAQTKAEAVEYAHKFADNVNYDGVSLKNANIINEQLNTLTQKYPINKLDEITSRSKGVMSANWHTLNINGKKLGKVIEDEELNYKLNQAMARASIENYKKRFPKMPPDIQRRVDSLEAELKYTRWGVQSSYPDHIRCVVTHEYGHILSDQYFGMINDNRANPHISNNWSIRGVQQKWKDVYKKAGQTGDIFKLSQYGGKNVKEFFAETFLAREMGEKLPKYIEDLMEETLRNGIL